MRAEPELAYSRYLAGTALAGRCGFAAQGASGGGAGRWRGQRCSVGGIEDPLSRLVAAGVLLRRGEATPDTVQLAVDTASARGWRRPLLAWLRVAQERAQAGGAADEVARLQRRIDLAAHPRASETGLGALAQPPGLVFSRISSTRRLMLRSTGLSLLPSGRVSA